MYKKVKANQVPKRSRIQPSRFESTDEWRFMRADIDRGLKPQEALQVMLTAEDKKRYKLKSRRTVARFIARYLKDKGLKYGVRSFQRDGNDYVIVQHTPVVRQTA